MEVFVGYICFYLGQEFLPEEEDYSYCSTPAVVEKNVSTDGNWNKESG
jgi:hypothetical protein